MQTRTRGIIASVCLLFVWAVWADDPALKVPSSNKVEVKLQEGGRFVGDLSSNVVRAEGGVKVISGDTTLHADRVEVNTKTKDFTAEGNVRIVQGAAFAWQGERVSGNFDTGSYHIDNRYFMTVKPWFLAAENTKQRVDQDDQKETRTITAESVKLSTCEHILEDKFFMPWNYRAGRVDYIISKTERVDNEGEKEEIVKRKIVLHNSVLQVFGVPVFYWPYLSMDPDSVPSVRFQQGTREDWGIWVKASKKFEIVENTLWFEPQIEHRHERGEAVRTDLNYTDPENRLAANLMLYWMKDRDPIHDYTAADGTEYNARYETRSLDRYRYQWHSSYAITENLAFRSQVDIQSDNDMIFEFFTKDFLINPEPPTYFDLSYLRDEFEASVNYRPQVNEFNSVVERLPEVRVDLPRQQLFDWPLYYQSENSLAQLRMNFREYDLARFNGSEDNSNYAAARFDSAHMFYLPFKLDWLNIMPRAGVRMTWYDRSSEQIVTADDINSMIAADDRRDSAGSTEPAIPYDAEGGHRTRWIAEYGMEMNFQAYNDWRDFESDFLNVDGLRHTVVPYVNYTFIPNPNEGTGHIYFFDEIDRIQNVNMLRIGLDQSLFGFRGLGPDRRVDPLLRMENYFDYYFDPDGNLPNAGEFGTVFEVTPNEWFANDYKILYEASDWRMDVFNTNVRFGKSNKLNLTLGYLFRNDYTQRYNYSFGSDLRRIFSSNVFPLSFTETESITGSVYIPIGSKNSLRGTATYDLLVNELATQRIEFLRRVGCWGVGVAWTQTGDVRGLELSIYLTAFPQRTRFGYQYDYDTGEE